MRMSKQGAVLGVAAGLGVALIVLVHDQKALAMTFLVGLGVLSTGFAVTYGVWSRWWATLVGRAVLCLAASFAALSWWIVLGWGWRDLPGRDTIRSVLYGSLLWGWLWLWLILVRIQRAMRAGRTIEDLTVFDRPGG